MGLIVDKDFKLQERFTKKWYEIRLDSPGYNEPTVHWTDQCNVNDKEQIENLRAEGKRQQKILQERAADEERWKEVE